MRAVDSVVENGRRSRMLVAVLVAVWCDGPFSVVHRLLWVWSHRHKISRIPFYKAMERQSILSVDRELRLVGKLGDWRRTSPVFS